MSRARPVGKETELMSESGNPAANMSLFDASTEFRGETAIVHASGEVDIASAPALALYVDRALAPQPSLLIIDLAAVTMLDSSGLGVLISVLKGLEAAGKSTELRLIVTEPHVLKVFSITGLDGVFSIFTSLDEAIAATS
jgi:anti-sigma B factor antagonist